jgi:hypothetical protein
VGSQGRAKEQGERGQMWWLYLLFMYKNRIMKPVEIVQRRRIRG